MAIRTPESRAALLAATQPRVMARGRTTAHRAGTMNKTEGFGPSSVSVTLPYPPTVNTYWRMSRGKMVVSGRGKAYKNEVAGICMVAHAKAIRGLVAVTVRLYRPRKVGDLDNTFKSLFDATKNVLFEDDDQIVRIVADRFDDNANPRVEIEVRSIHDPAIEQVLRVNGKGEL